MGSKHMVYICDPEKAEGKCKGCHYPHWCGNGSGCYSTTILEWAKKDDRGRPMLSRKVMRDQRLAFRTIEKRRRRILKGESK